MKKADRNNQKKTYRNCSYGCSTHIVHNNDNYLSVGGNSPDNSQCKPTQKYEQRTEGGAGK